ncbi:putative sterigmatocystin biosynthesis monooxygenase stcW [Fonsecaea pedrosoi]|nr:putative sterigmatocystin biosynthesis monooxygenase stcW [Fonsecaea pedrosoi]
MPSGSSIPTGHSTLPENGEYNILPQYHSQPSQLRVICVGAGAAGILVAYRMQKELKNYELVCYDKYENRYPGCACDLPAHAYVFPFEPNPGWSEFYASGPDILAYLENFVNKYRLQPFIKLNSRILGANWDEERGIYEVEVETGGETIKDWCHVFINGAGFLNDWKWPNIPGLHSFKGKLMHSAAWDPSVDYRDKKVAIIGTGSSAIQILPELQKSAAQVVTFMRSPTWIYPSIASDMLDSSITSGQGKKAEDRKEQYVYSEEEKKRFREDPDFLLQYRKDIEVRANDSYDLFLKGTQSLENLRRLLIDNMNDRIGPGHEELKKAVIPSWSPGCRRVTPGPGYLEALTMPNVLPVHRGIKSVVPEGIIDDAGEVYNVDIVVCATGFNIAFAPRFPIRGVNGVTMSDEFDPEPKVYLALTVPKFPNYFVVNGVRGNWAVGSVLVSHDMQVEYIVQCMKRMQQEGIKALEVRPEPIDELYEHIDEFHRNSVWSDDCSSWYKNGVKDGSSRPSKRLLSSPMQYQGFHYFKTIKNVRWEDYQFRYHRKNRWAFLGNGWTEEQYTHDRSRLAPYVRNEDRYWDFE